MKNLVEIFLKKSLMMVKVYQLVGTLFMVQVLSLRMNHLQTLYLLVQLQLDLQCQLERVYILFVELLLRFKVKL